ncbi:hypothetical protein Ancab_016923, partial [Ancistrocladus abbreviatus]
EPKDSPIIKDTDNEKHVSHSPALEQYNNNEETNLNLNKGAADVTPGAGDKLMYEGTKVAVSLITGSEPPLLHEIVVVQDQTVGAKSKNPEPKAHSSNVDKPASTIKPPFFWPTHSVESDRNLGYNGKRPTSVSRKSLCRGSGYRPKFAKKKIGHKKSNSKKSVGGKTNQAPIKHSRPNGSTKRMNEA